MQDTSKGGVSGIGLLTLVFIVLKLTGVIGWSWWWVLSPVWISALVTVAVLVLAGLFLLVVYVVASIGGK